MKTINISGIISRWDVSADFIREELKNAKGEDVLININSPGGSVFEGLEIYKAIKSYSGNTETRIVSLAASMGSIIALAGNKRTAEDTAVYMIHNPWSFAGGDYRDMEKQGTVLKNLAVHMSKLYDKKATIDLKEIRQLMDDESWLFADQIEKFGFEVSEIEKEDDSEDEESSMASAKVEFQACIEKLKTYDMSDEMDKVSASIEVKPTQKSKKPASAGKNKTEDISMDLEKFLAENPAEKLKYDAALEGAKTSGLTEGNKAEKRIKAAMPYIKADSGYPEPIRNLAAQVIEGTVSDDALLGAITVFDAMNETEKSKKAQTETVKQGETQSQETQAKVKTENTSAKTADEITALAKKDKGEV